MEGPGMSLFQGAASIHINNSAQDRLEEQEELEDQKRRNKELKDKLASAFDDLHDDDDVSSVNSSGNFTLEVPQSNGLQGQAQSRPGLPPTYVESVNHLKDVNDAVESPKPYCETPKNHHLILQQEDPIKLQFSPYGAGDGQNHYYQQENRGHMNGINNYDVRQECMNHEKLKVMYEMRVKECEQLVGQIKKLDMEVDSLQARLAAAVNDRDKIELSLQEAHNLLATSKHRLISLEQQVTALTDRMSENDQEKEQLRLELRSSNLHLQEVQQKLQTMQVTHSHDTDALFRELHDRHREETERLQTDLMRAKNKLDEKDNETRILERKCMEKDREKEEIIIEKGATINRLAAELEAAQTRLCSGEMAKLKERVQHLTMEKNTAREQVKEFGSKLEQAAHELGLCRSKYATTLEEYKNWRTTLYQILCESMPDNSYLGEPSSPGKLATLKEILTKYKLQLQKASTLQEEIAKRDKKIDQYRKLESDLRSKLEDQKAKEMQLTSRIAVLQNKLELLGSNSDGDLIESYKNQNEQLQCEMEQMRIEMKNLDLKYTELEMDHEKLRNEKGSRTSLVQEANADLIRELEKFSNQLKDTLKENGELKTLYLQACSSRDSASRELKNEQSKMQKEREYFKSQEKDFVERIEKEKQHVAKLSAELSSSKEELERANKRISELQKEFTDKQREFADRLNKYLEDEKNAIRKEIEPCGQCERQLKRVRSLEEQLNKCNVKLSTQESNETLMQELKGKAEFFQQYIVDRFKKINEQRTIGTNTETYVHENGDCHEEKAQSGDEEIATKTALLLKEKAIRDQIAEKFSLEMKTMEMDCARKVKELENEHLTAIAKLKELLERKAKEVDTLKDFILSERGKVTSILESKENEISVLIKDHNELQSDLQKAKDHILEWKVKAEKYKEKLTRYSSVEEALKSERQDLKQRLTKEWQVAKTQMTDLQSKMTQLQEKYDGLVLEHRMLQEKYKNVKKTVFTYRDYMAKKDQHVNSEISRIQDEYRKIFVTLQNQINYYVSRRVQEEERARSSQTPEAMQQYDYAEKMKKLNEEFAKLSKLDPNTSPE